MAIIHNLIARFRADTGTFDRNVRKSRTEMTRFGRDVKSMGKDLLALAGVGGGLYALQRGFRTAIKAASDLQETQAKFNTVFKSFSAEANKWAENFGKRVGRSEESVKSWMAGLQDTFVPLGIARDEAMGLSKELVTLAVDVASFNNAADPTVIRDFTSALVGNHETVRKYGIIISESAIKQEALRKGLSKTYAQLTDLEKVQLRYSLIQKGTTDAQGDALRTADSYANQMKRLKANVENLQVEIGGPLMEAINSLITTINENENVLSDWLTRPIKGAEELIKTLKTIPGVIDKLESQMEQKGVISKGAQGYGKFYGGITGLGNLPAETPSVPELAIPPARRQHLAEMRATLRRMEQVAEMSRKWTEEPIEPARIHITPFDEVEYKKAEKISKSYLDTINLEIELTGRVGDARQHAAMMIKLQNKLQEEGIENTNAGKKAVEDLSKALTRLEKAQKLGRIAEDIGSAFASAFEDMIFEAKKFGDIMKSLLRDISRSVLKNLVTQPIANQITMALGGTPATVMHGGGIVGQAGKNRNVPAFAFAGAPRLHNGLMNDEYPAILQRGEQVIPRGGAMMAPQINIYNESGTQIKQKNQPVFDGEKWVINIVAKDISTGGTLRKLIPTVR